MNDVTNVRYSGSRWLYAAICVAFFVFVGGLVSQIAMYAYPPMETAYRLAMSVSWLRALIIDVVL